MKKNRLTKEQKNARYKKRVAVFIAALMALSIVGFIGIGSFGDNGQAQTQNIEYNEFTFENHNGLWRLDLTGTSFFFQSPPTAVDTIQVPASAKEILDAQKVYNSKDPSEQIDLTGMTLFYRTLFLTKGVQSFESCLSEIGCADLPVISCEEETAIVARISEGSKITVENNCVVLSAPNELSRTRLAERLAYELLGVIQNE